MNSQPPEITWINRNTISTLVRQAGLSKEPAQKPPQRIGHGLMRIFSGSAVPGPSLLGSALPSIRKRDEEGPALPYPQFVPPALPLKQRVNSLMDWLVRSTGSSAAFLADADGLPLAQRNSSINLIGVSAIFADAAHQLARNLKAESVGAVHVDLDSGNTFHLIGIENGDQRLALGFVSRLPINAAGLSQIAESVMAAVAERPGDKASAFY